MNLDELFRPEAIDPETREFNQQIEKVLAETPAVHIVGARRVREAQRTGGLYGPLVHVDAARERTIAGPAGPLTLRIFVPDTVRGVYLHIHGGGWTIGAADQQDIRLWAIARHCSVAVVSVEYRLAPEHPYPAGPDDCEAAAVWLVANAPKEFGSDRLVIGGESAGAHLSAVTLLRMRDRHGFTGFLGANFTYGCFDLSMTPSVAAWGERNLVLNTPIIAWFTANFVPGEKRRRDPDVSPLYAELADMPPASPEIVRSSPSTPAGFTRSTRSRPTSPAAPTAASRPSSPKLSPNRTRGRSSQLSFGDTLTR
jgi:acetyl esterase/lipase